LVKQVIIHKLVDGVFYSSIIAEREGGEEILDARTSDAIALALRFNAPIFTYKDILNQAGIHLKTSPASNPELADQDGSIARLMDQEEVGIPISKSYKKYTLKELKELLSKAISQEDYETAAKLRDELSKRNQ